MNGNTLKRIVRLTALLMILCFSILRNVYAGDLFLISAEKLQTLNETHGTIINQPNGPFAVMLFNEFALGSHIGIIYYQQMANPVVGKWWISERFWQEKPWRDCVTSFAWGHDGKNLYVGTSEVYGDGGSFKLNLIEKTYTRLYPKKSEELKAISSTEILKIDDSNYSIIVQVTSADYKSTKTVAVTIE